MMFRHPDRVHVPFAALTIRRLTGSEADLAAIRTLAERDSRPVPAGPALVAEVDGRMLAAISLTTREVVADPFSRTGELRSLLELRAAQLRRRRRRTLRPRSRPRARAALAGSPPGAGGRLLEL